MPSPTLKRSEYVGFSRITRLLNVEDVHLSFSSYHHALPLINVFDVDGRTPHTAVPYISLRFMWGLAIINAFDVFIAVSYSSPFGVGSNLVCRIKKYMDEMKTTND